MIVPVISIEPLYIVNKVVGITRACCVGLIAWDRGRDLGVWAAGFALYTVAFFVWPARSDFRCGVDHLGQWLSRSDVCTVYRKILPSLPLQDSASVDLGASSDKADAQELLATPVRYADECNNNEVTEAEEVRYL